MNIFILTFDCNRNIMVSNYGEKPKKEDKKMGPEMFIIFIVIAGVAMGLTKGIATKIYQKTGVNTLNIIHKILWYVQLMGFAFGFSAQSLVLLIVTIIVGITLHTVLTLKAGIPNAIITGVVQGVGGAIIAFANFAFFVLGLVTGSGSKLGGMFSIDTSIAEVNELNAVTQEQVAQQQATAQAAERAKNEAADAYAQRLGFRDADDAERAGVDTGKYRK